MIAYERVSTSKQGRSGLGLEAQQEALSRFAGAEGLSDWSGNAVPDATTNATIAGTGTETVTVSANQSVNVLTLNDTNATLSVNGATLSAFGGLSISAVHEIDVTSGELLIGGGSQIIDNSTLNLNGVLTTDPASQTSAVLTLGPNLTVNATGGATIVGGFAAGDGIDNQGTINISGSLNIRSVAVTNEGTIDGSGSTLNITSGLVNNGTITATNLSLRGSNEGTITATGSGVGSISGFDNENAIAVINGDKLNFFGGINNGTISVGSNGRAIFSNFGGGGSIIINDAGTVEVQSGTLANTIDFAGIGTLQLDGPLAIGALSGLTTGDVIDFAHATLTSAIINGTTLTVTFAGGQTENLTLATALPAGNDLSSPQLDGAGGTKLVVVPTTVPTLTTPMVISGLAAQEGQTLTATAAVSSESSATITYQWQSSTGGSTWTNIFGETSLSHTVTEADEGAQLQIVATSHNTDGSGTTATSAATSAVTDITPTLSTPVIASTAKEGDVLSVLSGAATNDADTTLTYQWQRDSADITGATGSTYTVVEADEAHALRVVVTSHDTDGSGTTATSAATAAVIDVAPTLSAVTIASTAHEGGTLTATGGTPNDADATVTYQWQRDTGSGFANIVGASGATYLVAEPDEGAKIRVVLTATDVTGGTTTSSTSNATTAVTDVAPTLSVTVSGTAQEGQTLMAVAVANDSDATVHYQWQVLNGPNWANINGATAATYVVTEANDGHHMRVVATSSDADGSGTSATSTATAAVIDIAPTLSATVTGTAQERQTLTAHATANDSDVTIGYQWQYLNNLTWTNITGATASTYVVTEANEGHQLRVVAISSDNDGSGTSATSAATAVVIDIVPTLTVSGGSGGREPKNTTLTANLTNTESGATIAYQWQSSTNNTTWTNISGATSSTYKVAPALNNDFFRVRVAYTDDEAKQTLTSSDAAEPPFLTVKNATASETATSIRLSITDTTVDSDDTLLPVTISGVPTSWTLSDGLSAPTSLGNGTWTVAPDALASLVILPPTGGFNQGIAKLTVTASNLDTDGAETETLSTSSSLTVTIHPGSTPIDAPHYGTHFANIALLNQFVAAGLHEQNGIPIVAISQGGINSGGEAFLTQPHH
jgi:hypothetical protein